MKKTRFGLVETILFKLAIRAVRRKAGLHQRMKMVDGENWFFLEGGDGPPIIALHGFTANKDHWSRMAGYLTSAYRLIAPDLPGFGETARHEDWIYDIDHQVSRLHAFVTSLGLDRFHLIGNSMGGQLSAAYALAHADKVITLGLIDHAGIAETKPSEMTHAVERGENPLVVEDEADYDRVLRFVFSRPPVIPPKLKSYLARQDVANKPFNEKIFKDLQRNWRSFENDFPTLQTPTLVLWGADDRVFDVSAGHRSHALLPHSELVVLEHTGHVPPMENPKETAAAVADFIRRCGGS